MKKIEEIIVPFAKEMSEWMGDNKNRACVVLALEDGKEGKKVDIKGISVGSARLLVYAVISQLIKLHRMSGVQPEEVVALYQELDKDIKNVENDGNERFS